MYIEPKVVKRIIIERTKADGTKEYAANCVIDYGDIIFGIFRNRERLYVHSNFDKEFMLVSLDSFYHWFNDMDSAKNQLEACLKTYLDGYKKGKIVDVRFIEYAK